MKLFFVCGESSGDHLSSLIVKELIEVYSAEIMAMGGRQLNLAGAEIIQDIAETQVMGWLDVLIKIPKFKRLLSSIKQAVLDFNPDAVVLVDFGSFNLRLAEWCSKQGIRVVYFIPPKVWASREGRIENIKKYCDQIIVIFPFEKEYFNSKGLKTEYYGNPLANIRNKTTKKPDFLNHQKSQERPIIALLPGSREQEIKHILTPMVRAASQLKGYQICISQAKDVNIESLEKFIPKELRSLVQIISDSTYQLLLQSEVAIVASGTATLECALLDTPMIVCYKTNFLNYLIAKQIIQVPFISLPNLILSENVVPELIQGKCNAESIFQAIKTTLSPTQLSTQRIHFRNIYNQLYNPNTISSIAKAISNKG